jgi:hypothetical protein
VCLDLGGKEGWARDWNPQEPVIWTTDTSRFLDLLGRVDAGIVAAADSVLLEPGSLHSVTPLLLAGRAILLLPLDSQSVRICLDAKLPSRAVIWIDDLPQALNERIAEIRKEDFLAAFGEALIQARSLTPVLGTAIRRLCRSRPPPKSFLELTKRVGLPESTLRYYWRLEIPDLIPKEFLDWAILKRTCEHAAVWGQGRATAWIGVHPRTLGRIALRRTDTSAPRALTNPARLRSWFLGWATQFLDCPGIPRQEIEDKVDTGRAHPDRLAGTGLNSANNGEPLIR